jgi:membrane protease YdiL (CAAX protease family)
MFVATVANAVLDEVLAAQGEWRPAFLLLPALAAGLIAVGWVWLVCPRPRRLGWDISRPWRPLLVGLAATGVSAIPVLALYLGIQHLQMQYMLAHQPVPGALPPEHPMVPVFVAASGWRMNVVLVGAACVILPALEETLFRGILYRGLRREWAFAPAALVSALVFAVAHLNPAALVPYMLLGVLFAYLYERSSSLVAPWAAHAAFNGFNVAILMAIAS